jgi:hypothetical protein
MSTPYSLNVYYNPDRLDDAELEPKNVTFEDSETVRTIENLIADACKAYDIDENEVPNYLLRMKNKLLLLNDPSSAFAMQDVMLVSVNLEVKSLVLKLEDIAEELLQSKTMKNFNDVLNRKEVTMDSKNFLAEMTKNFELKNDAYIEEFISLGGSNQLMSLAVLLDGALLGYCLKTFYVTTIYYNGVEFIRKRPENVYKLYDLLDKEDTTVKKNTLGILCSLLRDMKGAFSIINKAAVTHGFKNERSPYSPLLEALHSKDLEMKEKVLHFFNWMIFKCPKEEFCCKFQSRLENLGVFEECQKVGKTVNSRLRKQLMLFQQNNNVIIKSSMYELEIHRTRITELEKHTNAFEKRLAGLQEQQNFYTIMKKDYQKFCDLAKQSMEKPTLFNPFTQVGNYKKEDLMKLPVLKRNIVDLREAIQENKEFTDKLNQEKDKIEDQCRELQEQVDHLNSENYELREQDQKMKNEKKKIQEVNRVNLQKTRAELRESQSQNKVYQSV